MNAPIPIKAATPRDRATGAARFAADLIAPGAALVAMAASPHAHARVTAINTQAALEVPGVLGVLTAADFAGLRLGEDGGDEPVLTRHVRYRGEAIAAVAGVDQEALLRGIEALAVEYEILPAAFSPAAALALATPIHAKHPDNIVLNHQTDRGDWQRALDRVDFWVEGKFECEAVPHAYLEPRATLARVRGERLELVTGTHAPAVLLAQYQNIVRGWGVELDIITPDIGGSFGAKWEHPSHVVCLAFAHRLGREVAMVSARRDDMIAGRTRLPMCIEMRIGATNGGELVAKETTVLADNGAYSLHGPGVIVAAAVRSDNLYRFSAIKARSKLVYTNNVPTECFRGYGIPQASFAQEQLVDEIARRLDHNPVELRRANATRRNETTVHGWKVRSCGLGDCLNTVSQAIEQHRRQASAPISTRYRVGYGVAACIHCISNCGYDQRPDQALINLAAEPDGTIRITAGEVELGCGTVDMLRAVVARELAIERDRFRVTLGDTSLGPFGRGSFASRTTFFDAWAAMDACGKFKAACGALAAEFGLANNAPIGDFVERAAALGRSDELKVTGEYEPAGTEMADASGHGNISAAYTYGVHGCCVRIDTLTGKTTVEQYWAAHDAGTILNPIGAEAQVLGGVVQGLGYALSETLCVGANGEILNPGFLDDRVPTFPDAPPIEVTFAPTFEDAGPSGAKSIGEPPIIPVAACVANAIYDALGVRQTRLPMTAERVWRSLGGGAEKIA